MTLLAEPKDRPAVSAVGRAIAHPIWPWLIIALGTALRLRRYLQDRGLMHDDAQLATNIFSKSFAQLLKPLDIGDQAAPAGFLILQKCSTVAFGHGELAFRLVPFLASVIVLPLFFLVVRKIAGHPTALFATAWLAFSEPLVRYSSEGKQYSTDVLWTTVAIALALLADTPAGMAVFTVIGAVLLWFSHPLLFVLGGIGLSLFVQNYRTKSKLLVPTIVMGAVWLASFGLNYWLISRFYVSNPFLADYWQKHHGFAPLPHNLKTLLWYPQTIAGLFDYPLGILPSENSGKLAEIIAIVGFVIFVLGWIGIALRKPRLFGFITLPILLALAASALHRYPFGERLTLFCAPLCVLPLAFAMASACGRKISAVLVAAPCCAILFAYPLYIQAKYAAHPDIRYDAKPAIDYVKSHWQPGDSLYLHCGSDVLGTYYLNAQPPLPIPADNLIHGDHEANLTLRPQKYADDLLKVQGRSRVWVVFSMDPDQDEPWMEQTLAHRGKLIEHRQFNGSTADLYDLH